MPPTPAEDNGTNTTKPLERSSVGSKEDEFMKKLWRAFFDKGLVDYPGPPKSKKQKLRDVKQRQQERKQKLLRKEKEALGMI